MTEETIKEILKFRDDREWKQFHNPKDLAISISVEAAELLEVFQWSGADVSSGHSQTGIKELNYILGRGHGFETVKPLKLIEKIIQLWCPPEGLVLDPFAGSGTTAHAVLELNLLTESKRNFIIIEKGEKEDKYAKTLTRERGKFTPL